MPTGHRTDQSRARRSLKASRHRPTSGLQLHRPPMRASALLWFKRAILPFLPVVEATEHRRGARRLAWERNSEEPHSPAQGRLRREAPVCRWAGDRTSFSRAASSAMRPEGDFLVPSEAKLCEQALPGPARFHQLSSATWVARRFKSRISGARSLLDRDSVRICRPGWRVWRGPGPPPGRHGANIHLVSRAFRGRR